MSDPIRGGRLPLRAPPTQRARRLPPTTTMTATAQLEPRARSVDDATPREPPRAELSGRAFERTSQPEQDDSLAASAHTGVATLFEKERAKAKPFALPPAHEIAALDMNGSRRSCSA